MAARCGLSACRDILLYAVSESIIDDEEFMLLYDYNLSREIYPYWRYERFNLDSYDDGQCLTEFRFLRRDLETLADALQIPEKIVCPQRTICWKIEGLCIFLKRVAYPCRYTDMVPHFGRNPTELCLIFNQVLDHVYDTHQHRMQSWNQFFLQPNMLREYADAIERKGAPLTNCFGFVDGTVLRICRPTANQRVVYNGHKRVHGIKFQSVALPNGLIGNFDGPYEGRRHDSTILQESGLLIDLQRVAWFNQQPLCIYGDPAYPLQVHLQAPFRTGNLAPNQESFNKAMSEVRVAVEWLFGEIKTFFKFVDFKSQQKIGLSAVGKVYVVCALLQNARACMYGNKVSEYFDIEPPTLQEYFQ